MILRRWGYRLSTHDLLSGVALSPKTDRIPCISYVPNPLQSSPKTVFQLVIVSVNDCDSDNTHHIFEKFLQPQQDIGSIQCLDSFLPFCNPTLNERMKQSTLWRDFLSTRWKAEVLGVVKTLNMPNEALIKFLELLVTHSWQRSCKLETGACQKWSCGLEIIGPH